MTKQISNSMEINFINSNTTIFHFAAEYNATRVQGIQLDMNQLMKLYMQGKWTDNHSYFARTRIQSGLMSDWLNLQEENCNFFYGDVSMIPSKGKHSAKETYQRNVRKSIAYHQNLFEIYKPYAVCIAGGIALDSFISIVLPHIQHKPKYVIGTRNPSNQGHFGSPEDWFIRYQESQNLKYPKDGHIYKLVYKKHLQKFVFQRWKESKSRSTRKSPKTLNVSQKQNSSISAKLSNNYSTNSSILFWDRFESVLENKDISISNGPDSQNRYSFSYKEIEVLHQVKMKENYQVGAGYYSVRFGKSNGFYTFEGVDYQLNKAGHIKIQDALANKQFFGLLFETYNKKMEKCTQT